jgi:hypothetical protein
VRALFFVSISAIRRRVTLILLLSADEGKGERRESGLWKIDFAVTYLRLFITSAANKQQNPLSTFHFPSSTFHSYRSKKRRH